MVISDRRLLLNYCSVFSVWPYATSDNVYCLVPSRIMFSAACNASRSRFLGIWPSYIYFRHPEFLLLMNVLPYKSKTD